MKQLFKIMVAFFHFLGHVIVITGKFLIFLLISPITIFRCIPYMWRKKSFRAGWLKFSWIWDAYWGII